MPDPVFLVVKNGINIFFCYRSRNTRSSIGYIYVKPAFIILPYSYADIFFGYLLLHGLYGNLAETCFPAPFYTKAYW